MSSRRSRPRLLSARFALALLFLLSAAPQPELARGQAVDCRADIEPNNLEAEVELVESEFCIAGDLPEASDQDLFLWTVTETDAKFLWTMTVSGPTGVATSARVLSVTSEPGVQPVVAGTQIGDVSVTPEATGPVSSSFLVAEGRYLVGISRSDTATGPPITTAYQLSLEQTRRLPKRLDDEPNDQEDTASPLEGAFEATGNLLESVDVYAWSVAAEDAESGWELHLQTALGVTASMSLISATTREHLVLTSNNGDGRIALYDLVPEPGDYLIQIGPGQTAAAPYLLTSTKSERAEHDREPNDQPAGAAPIDLANPVLTGRLAAANDVDLYRLAVDEQLAGSLFDVRLISRSGQSRRLCIVSLETGEELQCKEAPGGAALSNILLPRGNYLVRVSGPADPSEQYILRLDVTTAPSPSFEAEPNDVAALAAKLDLSVPMQGRFDGADYDVYGFSVTGDPQLWEVVVTGSNVFGLEYLRRDGTELSTGEVNADRTSARLSDLYLTPGDHWLQVNGESGEYSITVTPLGPPPPDGEHEANNTAVTAEPLLVGERKTGRLAEVTDVDYFRFSLAAEEHIVLRLEGPDDGTLQLALDWATRRVANLSTAEPGERATLDLMLLPGDYVVSLYTRTPSTGRYALEVLRDDPFALGDDQEPNDSIWMAQPFPAGSEVSGSVSSDDPYDYYAIAPEPDRDLRFVQESTAIFLSLVDEQDTFYTLLPGADGVTWTVSEDVPDDLPLYLRLSGDGDYTVSYGEAPDTGPDLPGFLDVVSDVPLEASLQVDTSEIAAYWHESQVVDGLLTLTNSSDETVEFVLSSATSHYHFIVEIDDAPSMIDAGTTLEVPISIQIEPDAWANIPVRITVAALLDQGQASAFAEITPTAEAPPLNPAHAWPLPIDLLGGLDLASPVLGATVAGTIDPAGEALLHDGVTPYGVAFLASAPVLPLTLTVDLAGDAPAPVSGIVLHPQSYSGLPWQQVRAFELLLSTDGVNFVSTWRDELSLIAREQWFVLPAPIEATHAQLVILSTYDTNPTQPLEVSLNEWSVIGTPGYVPETVDRLNIADLSLGGHIVRSAPQISTPELAESMLTSDLSLNWLRMLDATSVEWVVGFAQNRAARMTELTLTPSDGSDPAKQVAELEVAVSMGTSGGPWEVLGTWNVQPQPDGSVSAFVLDEPVWARFVRLSGPSPEGELDIQLPGQVQIFEAPISDDYRSVIGAWGATSSSGFYEQLNPPPPVFWGEEDVPDEMDSALPLALEEEISNSAHAGNDVDWFRVTVPEDDNTLTFTLRGAPTVDVVARIYDEDGSEVEATRAVVGDSSTVTYTATVEPAGEYVVRVEQPPHSIVFAFDTSGSMGGVLPVVYQSLRSFAGSISEGQEFVQVMPFETDPLFETWSDDQYVVYSAINGFVDSSGSSSAEATIADATELLADQEGTTAILIITDAETSSYGSGAEMWGMIDVVQPRIFTVHVGGTLTPARNEQLMRDWSGGSGYYQYATHQGEMDRAFDRAATWLRRPAGYNLVATSSFQEPATPTPEPTVEPSEPGTLTVVAPEGSSGEEGSTGQVSQAVTIEIILDTSGSMLAGLPDGQRRIDVARTVLTDLVLNKLPPGVPVALRVFGSTPDSCETSLLVPPQPLDPQAMAGTIQSIEPVNLVKTPLGASLEQVATDLAGVPGPKIVVLVTDGEETCDGDPARAIQALAAQGIEATVNIVGFALDDDALREQFGEWAELGGGTYFDATSAEELDQAIAQAVQAPFQVLDETGAVMASGTVGGNPVDLPAGTYTVVVLTDPEQRYEAVVIEEGEEIELQLGG